MTSKLLRPEGYCLCGIRKHQLARLMMVCTTQELYWNVQIRMCLLYDFKFGLKATESVNRINIVFAWGTFTIRYAQRWFKRFREDAEGLEDMPRPQL
ncbi:hypothetical protein RB195_000984 [Necator americanus]|uniref:Mos1 transposase HTH domain-containing protein n=1 Tax=Necator americanus TaxID=51031 RepID=A0ABR1DC73_NECAM